MSQHNLEAAAAKHATRTSATRVGPAQAFGLVLTTVALTTATLIPGASASAASPSAPSSPKATWSQLQPATSPSPRSNPAMAYDPDTGQFILFSGWPGRGYAPDDTWEWTGSNWTELHPATSPPGRYNATFAYDAATGQLLLFGGVNHNGNRNDTWDWNGTTWVEFIPPTARHPEARPP